MCHQDQDLPLARGQRGRGPLRCHQGAGEFSCDGWVEVDLAVFGRADRRAHFVGFGVLEQVSGRACRQGDVDAFGFGEAGQGYDLNVGVALFDRFGGTDAVERNAPGTHDGNIHMDF